jgi:hypothetical protein
MLHMASSPPSDNPNLERNRLARVRRRAKKRGFRVLKDWTGCRFHLIDTYVFPPRALVELNHVSLDIIEAALAVPLPPPRPPRRRRRGHNLTECNDAPEWMCRRVARLDGNGLPQPSQASHPAATSFTSLVDLLKGGAS